MNEITYDSIYSDRKLAITLLYKKDERPIVISLPYASLMTFLKCFHEAKLAANHMTRYSQCLFQLYAFGDNMLTWPSYLENKISPNNLIKIKLFCRDTKEQNLYQNWSKRYPQIVEVLTIDQLEQDLIISGLKLIENLRFEIEENGILNLLEEDFHRLRHALIGSFDTSIAIANHDIQMSEEAN
ncbi:hypothetical protein I4U23_005891 [Adineta vaga]|nr:hypothetical protein I4U23_005891 [Adineta vaga]